MYTWVQFEWVHFEFWWWLLVMCHFRELRLSCVWRLPIWCPRITSEPGRVPDSRDSFWRTISRGPFLEICSREIQQLWEALIKWFKLTKPPNWTRSAKISVCRLAPKQRERQSWAVKRSIKSGVSTKSEPKHSKLECKLCQKINKKVWIYKFEIFAFETFKFKNLQILNLPNQNSEGRKNRATRANFPTTKLHFLQPPVCAATLKIRDHHLKR